MSRELKSPEKYPKTPTCTMCGDPVLPGQGWEACRGRRGGIAYTHKDCIVKRGQAR